MLRRVLHLLGDQRFRCVLFTPRKETLRASVFRPFRYLPLLAVLSWGLATTSARADFVVETDFSADVKFFNSDAFQNVSSFTGNVGGQHSGPEVTVSTGSSSVTVDTGAGYATIKPDMGTLTSLKFTPADSTLFSDFSFRGQLNAAGSVTVTVVDQGGTSIITFDNLPANTDFGRLGVVSTDGDTIESVTITSDGWKEVKQVDFSGVGLVPSVPEPATITMFGIGALSLVGYGWRRNRRPN